jgi:YHS domain-containing protein
MEDTMKNQNTCPVMGHEIEDISNAPSSVFNGTTYYFCCENCKESFDANPTKYVGGNGGGHHGHHGHHHH